MCSAAVRGKEKGEAYVPSSYSIRAVCIYYATHKHYSRSIILIRLENGIPDTDGIFNVLKSSPE